MSATYIPTSTYHPYPVLPSPSDPATAASVNRKGLQYLADNDLQLRNEVGIFWDGTNIGVPSGNVTAVGTVSAPQGLFQNASVYNDLTVYHETSTLLLGVTDTANVQTLNVFNNAQVGGAAYLASDVGIGGNVNIAGTSDLVGNVVLHGTIDGSAGTVVCQNNFNVLGQVFGNLILSLTDGIFTSGPVLNIRTNVQTFGNMDVIGGAARVPWRPFIGPDADTTISGSAYNLIMSFGVTANRTWTIDNIGAQEGDWFFGSNRTPAALNVFFMVSTGDSVTLGPGEAVLYGFISGGWRVVKKWS